MKPFGKLTTILLAAGALLAANAQAQVNVYVDYTKPWQGWMNSSELTGGGTWGSGWALADLPAVFSGPLLTLSPNVNCWNPSDPYWVKPDGTANRIQEANTYVDTSSLGGNLVTFSGMVLGNTLAQGYTVFATIKEFGPGYSWVGMTTVPLVGGTPFTVQRNIPAGGIIQYGFMLTGPVADPATVAALGNVTIEVVPEPATFALLGLGLLGLAFTRRS